MAGCSNKSRTMKVSPLQISLPASAFTIVPITGA
jgi:hypothetical protein